MGAPAEAKAPSPLLSDVDLLPPPPAEAENGVSSRSLHRLLKVRGKVKLKFHVMMLASGPEVGLSERRVEMCLLSSRDQWRHGNVLLGDVHVHAIEPDPHVRLCVVYDPHVVRGASPGERETVPIHESEVRGRRRCDVAATAIAVAGSDRRHAVGRGRRVVPATVARAIASEEAAADRHDRDQDQCETLHG